MLSPKCKYAFRAVLYLAVNGSASNKCGITEITTELKLPQPYLSKILHELVRKGILSSAKGPNGGFYLTESNANIKLLAIVQAVDGLLSLDTCGLGLENCSSEHPCPIHYEYIISRTNLKSLMVSKTIGQLAQEVKENNLTLVR